MKTFIYFVVISVLGFATGYHRGFTGAVADENEKKLQQMFDESAAVIGEMRGLTADAHAAVAGVRKAEQERNSEGEKRRENMSTAMRADECAGAVVPVAVSDGLLRKGKGPDKTDSRTNTAKPD